MNNRRLLSVGVGLLTIVSSLFVPLFSEVASAATLPDGWVNQTEIVYNGKTFTDTHIDDTWEFHDNGDKTCDNIIHDFDGGESGSGGTIKEKNPTGAYYLTRSSDPATGECKPSTSTKGTHIDLANVANSKADFLWTDSSTVTSITGSTFALNTTDKLYHDAGGYNCKDSLSISSDTSAILIVRTTGGTSYNKGNLWVSNALASAKRSSSDNCIVYSPIAVALSNYNNARAVTGASTAGSNDGSCAVDTNNNCAAAADGTLDCKAGSLNWVVCPVINVAQDAAETLDNFITKTLDINVGQTFDNAGYYTAWNSFRVLSTAIIVIAGLVMVASQAIGFEFLDAYTIRKTLPRLLVAIIGISLSWPLMRFAVGFFNVLGLDIRSIMYAPFKHLNATINPGIGVASSLTAIIGVGALVILGPAELTLILTGLLALFLAFIILIVRQVAIIILLILAPVAIACYVLPNTQKVWKLWTDNFLGLMLMFPIISAFIAAGHIFAAVSITNGGGISQLIGMVAYFAPYFLLPFAFRLATGTISTVAGMVNDRGKGAFDRMKKYRGEKSAERLGRARSNSLFDASSKRGKLGNKMASWATDPVSNAQYAGRNSFAKRSGGRIASQLEHTQVEQTGKLFEEINKMGFNDKGLRALSGMHYGLSKGTADKLQAAGLYGKAPRSLNELNQMASILGKGDASEQIAGNAMQASAGRLATLYQDPEMGKASIAGAGIMGLAAHGFADSRDLSNAANMIGGGKLETQFRTDENGNVTDLFDHSKTGYGKMHKNEKTGMVEEAGFAQSIVSQAQLLGQRSRPDVKPGYGVMYNASEGRFLDGMAPQAEGGGGRARSLLTTLNSHDLAAAKGGAIRKLEPTIKQVLTAGGNDAVAVKDQLFSWAGPYSQASVDVKSEALRIIADQDKVTPNFQADFDKYRRTDVAADPDRRGGPPPDPPASGGGGA